MRIQHNIMAMNSYRNYNNNIGTLGKNLEKLSSGYRINRAGDDAAGLAISEKMRAQITGLDAAQKNVKDGISLVKTAEGALQEVQDMMNRMKYLATQSANGTYQNEVDRENLQKEVEALKTEINRIADSSNFNGQKLLDGTLAAKDVVSETAEGTELQDMIFTKGTNTTINTVAASGASTEVDFGATLVGNDAKHEAYKITYVNEAGETKVLTLVENAVNGQAASAAGKVGLDFKAAWDAGKLTISDSNSNAKADLAEFKSLFKIEAGTGDSKVKITAKDADSKAKVTGVAFGSETAPGDAATKAAAVSVTTTDAHDTYGTVQVTATTATFTLGDKTYEVTTGDAATDAADAASKLMAMLKEDGYDVELDPTDTTNTTIKINNLQEKQKGVQIENASNDKWDVNASASTKGKATFTMLAAANTTAEHTVTLNYINENGESVSKDIVYKATAATATGNGTGLANAINSDSELKALFKASDDGNGVVTIESKGSGKGSAYLTGISTAAGEIDSGLVIDEPKDIGKELKMDGTKVIAGGDQITVDGVTYQFMNDTGASVEDGVVKVAIGDSPKETWENLQTALKKNGVESELLTTNDGLRFTDGPAKIETVTEGGLTLQIGDTADKWNQMNVTIGNMHVEALGIGDLDISDIKGAQAAVDQITKAINTVSSTRGDLGAIQNRLEHTTNNLAVMKENITDAESSIRDTDVADEMMKYTKNNILIQSAQAMLAQANQVPQGVLQLLQ